MTASQLILLPFSWAYGGVIAARNSYYDRNPGAAHHAGVPVISVGNLTAGGTGKTPLVIEIVKLLLTDGRRPAILTRGYAAKRGETPDEVLEFHDSLPTVPVVVNPDRVGGAAQARIEHLADCLVLDDGFQHRRLARETDIVVIDALQPWGGDFLLPAGRLREPVAGLRRAHAVVISRSNQVSPEELSGLHRKVEMYVRNAPILDSIIEATGCGDGKNQVVSPGQLKSTRILPVCGIGNPATYINLLRSMAGDLAPEIEFPDHHSYRAADVAAILRHAAQQRADIVLTTRKDWGKLATLWPNDASAPLLRLNIQSRVLDVPALRKILKLKPAG